MLDLSPAHVLAGFSLQKVPHFYLLLFLVLS